MILKELSQYFARNELCTVSRARLALRDGKYPSVRTYHDYPPISPPILTNKMAVEGPRPAESLRYLACSLAALDPAPWEKVRIVDQWKICSIDSLDWIAVIWCA